MKKNILRTVSIIIGLSLPLVGITSANAATAPTIQQSGIAPTSAISDTFAKRVFDLVNVERAKVKSQPLVWNQSISNVSQDWANKLEVATKDPKWSMNDIHRKDAGGSLIPKGHAGYSEIIGFNFTPESIVNWWMNSPGHKQAMLNGNFTDIGVGYVTPTSGPYKGWKLVVSNLARYQANVVAPPQATPSQKKLNVIDGQGGLWGYDEPGANTLVSRELLGQGWSSVNQLMTADWNNDGKMDLVAKWPNGQITMYQGIGNGDYKMPTVIGTGWGRLDITMAKLRKTDTHPGIVARDIVDGKLYYYPNNNGKMNAGRMTIGNGWQSLNELNAVDFDGDGNTDIVARNASGALLLYRWNGVNSFISESRKVVGTGWNMMDSVTVEPDLYGKGSIGLIGKSTAGILYYYPIAKNGFGGRKILGSSGWGSYLISEGSPN